MNCCPACGGDPTFLGTLGAMDCFRCRACGWDWQELADETEEEDCDNDGRFSSDAEADEEAVGGENWDGA